MKDYNKNITITNDTFQEFKEVCKFLEDESGKKIGYDKLIMIMVEFMVENDDRLSDLISFINSDS